MALALDEARAAGERGEVPVGAVIVDPKIRKVIATAGNETEARADPTAHAEILAIRAACKSLNVPRLPGLDLYVTLEPCAMCATAIAFARIARVYYGAADPKGGAIESGPVIFSQPTIHHKPEIFGGFAEADSKRLLRAFFKDRRGQEMKGYE